MTLGSSQRHPRSHRPSWRRPAAAMLALLAIAGSLLNGGPASADDDDWGPSVPGEFIVELAAGTSPGGVNAGVGGVGAPERLGPDSPLYRFKLPPSTDPRQGVERFKGQNGVVEAQPNVVAVVPEFYRRLFWGDNDPTSTNAPAASFAVGQAALGNAGLPARGATGRGVVVAVLDTGLDGGHPALSGRIAAGGYDFVDRDNQPAEVANGVDENGNGLVDEAFGHGTYVAGIVRLVAPDARILPIRIIDSDGMTSAWRIIQGVRHAQSRGAKVVNMSLGGLRLGGIVERDLEARANAGLVLVAAAGNENTGELRFPAANPGVVGVTAIVGTTGHKADFANFGSWIDIAAPGVRIVSAYPANRYASWGGTSAAAPVVAGAAALVAQAMGTTAASDDIVDRLTSTGRPEALPNVSAYGRVDVQAAVNRALGR